MKGPQVAKWNCPHKWDDDSVTFREVEPGEDEISISDSCSEFVAVRNPEQLSQFVQALMAATTQIGWLEVAERNGTES